MRRRAPIRLRSRLRSALAWQARQAVTRPNKATQPSVGRAVLGLARRFGNHRIGAHGSGRPTIASPTFSRSYGTSRRRPRFARACCKAPRHAASAIRAQEFAAASKNPATRAAREALGHSTREHHDFRAMLQQFLHIGNLNTGPVSSSCLAPVPFT